MNPGQSNGKCGVKVKWWVGGVGAVNPEQRETQANKGMLKIQIWHSENGFPLLLLLLLFSFFPFGLLEISA